MMPGDESSAPGQPPSAAGDLELPRIREQVAARAAAAPGADRIRAALPFADSGLAIAELDAVTQMGLFLAERGDAVFPCFYDTRLIERLRVEATALEAADFIAVRKTLSVVGDLRKKSTHPGAAAAPRVTHAIAQLPPLPELARALDQVFTSTGDIRDDASPALSSVRRTRKGVIASLESSLKQILRDSRLEKWLAEGYFTQLNARYVILVKADAKGHIPGIVQGQSKSGVSLYVEPLGLVEKNNDLIRSFFEEEQEIARILRRLAESVRRERDALDLALGLLAWLDSLAARSRWAAAAGARAPEFAPDLTFDLRRARHPLLGDRCVPIDIRAGPEDRVLVLGGANSGGKTVALKTVGLLHLMAASGFPIPCDEGSTVAFFANVHCEIGDKQSIDANLSSFSSHASDVAAMLRSVRRGDLVLLDEFMTGTDPQEGSALAEAVLLELARRGATVLITTHYNSIKLLKDRNPGFKNYAVEFDWGTLAPTYRLLENEHGASAGLEIAARFGIPSELVLRARELLARGEGSLGELMTRLEAERARARSAGERQERLAAEAGALRDDYERQLSVLKEERRVGLSKRLREERQELVALRDYVREALKTGQPEAAREALEERAETLERQAVELAPAPSAEPLQEGDRVRVLDLDVEGELVDLGAKHVTVRLASGVPLKTRLEALRKLAPKPQERGRPQGRTVVERAAGDDDGESSALPLELNLIQQRAEEAKEKLAWYLDRASARGYVEVRIVHGKGDGVLRRVVEEVLRSSVYAVSWRPGALGEGDTGVTIVRLVP